MEKKINTSVLILNMENIKAYIIYYVLFLLHDHVVSKITSPLYGCISNNSTTAKKPGCNFSSSLFWTRHHPLGLNATQLGSDGVTREKKNTQSASYSGGRGSVLYPEKSPLLGGQSKRTGNEKLLSAEI